MVTRKWTQPKAPGRLPLASELAELIVGLARDNPSWGVVRFASHCLHAFRAVICLVPGDPGHAPRCLLGEDFQHAGTRRAGLRRIHVVGTSFACQAQG